MRTKVSRAGYNAGSRWRKRHSNNEIEWPISSRFLLTFGEGSNARPILFSSSLSCGRALTSSKGVRTGIEFVDVEVFVHIPVLFLFVSWRKGKKENRVADRGARHVFFPSTANRNSDTGGGRRRRSIVPLRWRRSRIFSFPVFWWKLPGDLTLMSPGHWPLLSTSRHDFPFSFQKKKRREVVGQCSSFSNRVTVGRTSMSLSVY